MWDSLPPSVHELLCNPDGQAQFCALPSECLALWQRPQLCVSVHHASSVLDMPGAQVAPCQHLSFNVESHAPSLPVFTVLHILHTLSPNGSGFLLVQHTSHTKIKTHFILQCLIRFWQTIHL